MKSVPITQLHCYLGANPLSISRTRFGVWSPTSENVAVQLVDQDRVVPMTRTSAGYHVIEIDDVGEGDRYLYQFRAENSTSAAAPPRPDPASRRQPDGVHGPSAVVARDRYPWRDAHWAGILREDLIIYELHVGAFTAEGTFLSAIERLDELVELGITAIELMPVAESAGRWNWGYDGVCLFAPSRNYGSPDELRQLVEAAHAKGLAVFLDVVYNHLGPEGNYLGETGPYLSPHHATVWGAAPNFDDPVHGGEVRRFFIANAIHWFDEYHIDGLRVDAIHCIRDDSPRHVVAEMSEAVKQWSQESGQPALLIAESNVYDPNMLAKLSDGGVGFDAEWCDDFLHSVYAVVCPGEQVCHRTYVADRDLDQTLKYGYVYEGTLQGERGRQSPSKRVDTRGLIYSIQHHDFIGNHPIGKRLHQSTSRDTQRAAAALLMLSPAIPMLFMGEEFACECPFQFFVDFTDEHLRQAVVEGRKREYPQHDWSAGRLPIDPRAFADSKIGAAAQGDQAMRQWYKSLIQLRQQWRSAGWLSDANLSVENDLDRGLFVLRYSFDAVVATVCVRLVCDPQLGDICPLAVPGELILDSRLDTVRENQILPNHAKVFVAS